MESTTNTFFIPASAGEIYDKYSILQIKYEKISDIDKCKIIKKELDYIEKYISKKFISNCNEVTNINIYEELKKVNELLWNIEDDIRIKEQKKEFDDEFIYLARQVYKTNDKRYEIKKQINNLFNSNIYEIKSYSEYEYK